MNVIIPITYPDGFRAGVTAMYIVWLFGIFHAASAPLCVAPLGGERSRKPAFECVAPPTQVEVPEEGESQNGGI